MNKSKQIIFRVSEENYKQIEDAANGAGRNANDWCRDLILSGVGIGAKMTANERVIFEELAKVRYMIGIGFGLLGTRNLTEQSWEKTKNIIDEKGSDIADALLKRRK